MLNDRGLPARLPSRPLAITPACHHARLPSRPLAIAPAFHRAGCFVWSGPVLEDFHMKFRCCLLALFVLAAWPVDCGRPVAQEAIEPGVLFLRECLVLPAVGQHTRSPVHTDALEAQLVAGSFSQPKASDKVTRADGSHAEWKSAKATEDGWLSDASIAGGYAYWRVESAAERVALLNARGHTMVYVNGEPRYGDPYDYGYVRAPFIMKKGVNEFLFLLGRGRVKAQIDPVKTGVSLVIGDDWTLPDIVEGSDAEMLGGSVNVYNVSPRALRPRTHASLGGNESTLVCEPVPPLSVSKVRFVFPVPVNPVAGTLNGTLRISVGHGDCEPKRFSVSVVPRSEPWKHVFASRVDGSLQYCALRRAAAIKPLPLPGLLVSLHGASVEAIGQARAYGPKASLHLVAPTNRRPFGFDWEDWGRLDALEAMEEAKRIFDVDATRVYLTGHSMGGHGTWSVGSMFPDKFAAIGPSAGWESFWSYAGGGTHPAEAAVSEILTRAANPYRTLQRKNNYRQQGIYILHGDADDNVPVTEARAMREALAAFHTDLAYFEQAGAGHWWDDGHDEGADCVDWAPMQEMFSRRRIPTGAEVGEVDFTTSCPEHSADCHWARIELQDVQLALSRVQISLQRNRRVFEGTTENVARLSLQMDGVITLDQAVSIQLDGNEVAVKWPVPRRVYLRKTERGWQQIEAADPALKGPHRYGWFKNAFNHQFVYVYGTGGTGHEQANFVKARYDLEQWWYRGNGSFEIIPDSDFDPAQYTGRNVILVGNADTNSAWDKVLKDCPVRVENGRLRVGDKLIKGEEVSVVFTYPRAGTTDNCVGVIAGTGTKGTRLTERLTYFLSGAAFPDLLVCAPDMLQTGTGGVLAAGNFGEDWSISAGEFKWRDSPKNE